MDGATLFGLDVRPVLRVDRRPPLPSCVSVSLANVHPAFGGSWADEVEDTIGEYSFSCPKPYGEAWRHSAGVSLIVSVALLP
jgi:hypothetical protein